MLQYIRKSPLNALGEKVSYTNKSISFYNLKRMKNQLVNQIEKGFSTASSFVRSVVSSDWFHFLQVIYLIVPTISKHSKSSNSLPIWSHFVLSQTAKGKLIRLDFTETTHFSTVQHTHPAIGPLILIVHW